MTEDRFDHIDQRIEAIIMGMGLLGDTIELTNGLIGDLIKKLDEPPSSDLPDLLKQLVTVVTDIHSGMKELPSKVARAVSTGEVE